MKSWIKNFVLAAGIFSPLLLFCFSVAIYMVVILQEERSHFEIKKRHIKVKGPFYEHPEWQQPVTIFKTIKR